MSAQKEIKQKKGGCFTYYILYIFKCNGNGRFIKLKNRRQTLKNEGISINTKNKESIKQKKEREDSSMDGTNKTRSNHNLFTKDNE